MQSRLTLRDVGDLRSAVELCDRQPARGRGVRRNTRHRYLPVVLAGGAVTLVLSTCGGGTHRVHVSAREQSLLPRVQCNADEELCPSPSVVTNPKERAVLRARGRRHLAALIASYHRH